LIIITFKNVQQYYVAMPRRGYRSLTIPEGLYQELEKFVELSNGSYVSISEVVREAIRGYLRKNTAET
jgi:Arc/MetJ-type ribon-helix-helix transcriptional regulator